MCRAVLRYIGPFSPRLDLHRCFTGERATTHHGSHVADLRASLGPQVPRGTSSSPRATVLEHVVSAIDLTILLTISTKAFMVMEPRAGTLGKGEKAMLSPLSNRPCRLFSYRGQFPSPQASHDAYAVPKHPDTVRPGDMGHQHRVRRRCYNRSCIALSDQVCHQAGAGC